MKVNYLRAILSGIIVWICVVITFYILELLPIIQNSLNLQALIRTILISIYAYIGATFYYKKARKKSGLRVGIIMSVTVILLDLLIFVPLVEIPKGNTYHAFFSNPLLRLLSATNTITVFLYWKLKFTRKQKKIPIY